MSRIGKKPIELPEKTTAELKGDVFTVTGPQGSLSKKFKSDIKITEWCRTLIEVTQGFHIALSTIRTEVDNIRRDRGSWSKIESRSGASIQFGAA